MGRPAKEFKLKENQLMYLTGIRDNVLSDPDVCHRATALLALNDGVEINEIAASLGVTKYTV